MIIVNILQMFHEVPGIVSKSNLRYEISDEWVVVSISSKGVRKVLKPYAGQVNLAGNSYKIYDVAKLARLEPKSWPDDELCHEWEELKSISDGFGFRYRMFKDARVQKMNQHGDVTYQEHTKKTDGYYTVSIAGKIVLIHQLMGETRFVPKPYGMPSNWTVHHIDNDPSNNHCDNLVWASPETQRKEQRPMETHRIVSCPVIGTALCDLTLVDGTMLNQGDDTQLFDNTCKAADAVVGGNRECISRCINSKQNSHANFTWKTPSNDEDFVNEVFKSIGSGIQYERFISNYGRVKYTFHNGYSKIIYAKDLLTERNQRESYKYPYIKIDGKELKFHRKVVELFFGKLPKTVEINGKTHHLIVDHIDDDKQNARLDNLQLLTNQENSKKRHLKKYTTSVSSSFEGRYENHATRLAAVEYVKNQGYPEATLGELNKYVNTPNKVYGRTWIRAHFETVE